MSRAHPSFARARALSIAGWLAACGLLLAAGRAATQPFSRVPVIFHVTPPSAAPADDAGAPRPAPDDFIREQLAHANVIFRPLGIELFDAGREALAARHARLVSRADRDQLLRYVRRGAVHCMVVATLMDVDEPGRERRGVHWRSRRDARHLVIVSTLARPYVLAHELGHFFGNREHSETPGNLMSYAWNEQVPFLDGAQKGKVEQTLRAMIEQGELLVR